MNKSRTVSTGKKARPVAKSAFASLSNLVKSNPEKSSVSNDQKGTNSFIPSSMLNFNKTYLEKRQARQKPFPTIETSKSEKLVSKKPNLYNSYDESHFRRTFADTSQADIRDSLLKLKHKQARFDQKEAKVEREYRKNEGVLKELNATLVSKKLLSRDDFNCLNESIKEIIKKQRGYEDYLVNLQSEKEEINKLIEGLMAIGKCTEDDLDQLNVKKPLKKKIGETKKEEQRYESKKSTLKYVFKKVQKVASFVSKISRKESGDDRKAHFAMEKFKNMLLLDAKGQFSNTATIAEIIACILYDDSVPLHLRRMKSHTSKDGTVEVGIDPRKNNSFYYHVEDPERRKHGITESIVVYKVNVQNDGRSINRTKEECLKFEK